MDITKQKELNEELKGVFSRYGVKNAAWTGSTEDSYIGSMGLNSERTEGQMASVINVGRLWQSAREQIRKHLDEFEK